MRDKQQADQVSINIFDLIDSTCADFRRDWKAGNRPRIEDYLLKVPENAREQLFRNLLTLEIRYRERAGDRIEPAEYLGRFPELKKAVGDAFHYSTSLSMEAVRATPAGDSAELTMTIEAPAANRIGDYELVRELGRGGFGVVYEANHITRRNRVVLKTLPTGQNGQEINAERLHKFRREFRSLSEINHPNLVGMQSLEVDGGQWFFTMDLIEGEDFLSYVRPNGKLDESRLREALKQLAAGVLTLHERRILHRDLKPSNVLVAADGRVSILDFGLVAELEQRTDQTASMQTQHFAGTPRYAAPEQVFGQRSPATDWYAVGTMLFEALTGETPYRGTAAELLIKKREEDAPQLSDCADLPTDLATLTDRLLRRAPEHRPASEEIAEALAVDQRTVSHGSTGTHDDEHSSVQSLSEDYGQILIGREEQLAQLEEIKRRFLSQRRPGVVWLTGLSGEGKSSLAEKFLAPLRRSGECLVLSGRCYDRESVPFKAVDVLVEALVSFLRSRSQDQVNAWLPQDIQLLARLFPTLRRVESIGNQPHVELANIDDRQIRYRAFHSLRELLIRISRETPVALFIDDLQWGDADSAEVLADLLAPPNPPAILLLGSYRSDEAEQSPFLKEWKHRVEQREGYLSGRHVEVTPLSEQQCLEFMAQRVGIPAERLRGQARDMLADTKGNPYFLEQLIEGFNADTGQFEPVPLRDILERKLRQLPEEAQDLLNAIAIAGQAVSVEEASIVAGHQAALFSTATHMRSERLVRLIGSDQQQFVDTYHDKVRETVLSGLEDSKRVQLHRRFGEALEKAENTSAEIVMEFLNRDAAEEDTEPVTTGRVFDMAYHFHAANDRRAFAYQLIAGELSYRAYASEDAIEFLQRSEECLIDDASAQLRFRLRHRLATSWMRLGRFESALEQFDRALLTATNEIQRALVLGSIGEVNNRLSNFEVASQYYDDALAVLSYPRPKSKFFLLLRTSYAAVLAHFSFLVIKPRSVQEQRKADLAARILHSLAWVEVLRGRSLLFAHAATDGVATAYRSGRPATVARLLTWLAWATSIFSLHFAARWYLSRAMRLASHSGSDVEQAILDTYLAGTIFYGGRVDEAEQIINQAVNKVEVLGESSIHRSIASHTRRHIHFVQGDSPKEFEAAKDELRIGESVGDRELICWAQYGLANAEARKGKLEEAHQLIQICLAGYEGLGNLVSKAVALHHLGFLQMQSSQYPLASRTLDQARYLIRQNLFYAEVGIRTYPWLMESLIGPQWNQSEENENVRCARRLVIRTRFFSWRFPTIHPHTLRVLGRLAAIRGQRGRAAIHFQKSIRSAVKVGARYDLARSLLDLAAVEEEDRDQNRKRAIALLKQLDSVIPAAESWLLGDQYDEAVVAPEFDLQAWEREHGPVSSSEQCAGS